MNSGDHESEPALRVETVASGVLDPHRPGEAWWRYQRPETAPPPLVGRAAPDLEQLSSYRPNARWVDEEWSGRPSAVVTDRPVGFDALGQPWWRYQRHEPPVPFAGGVGQSDELVEQLSSDRPSESTDVSANDADSLASLYMGGPSSAWTGIFGLGVLVFGIVMIGAHFDISGLGTWLIPAGALLLAWAFARYSVTAHPDEPWLGRWLILGVVAKLIASYLRYFTLVVSYGGSGDATGYDGFGRQFARAWLHGGTAPELVDLRRTNFIRWFTGVVYYTFGINMKAGFFVFGLLAVLGSYFWYRATAEAVPFLNRRLYFGLVMFAPSIAFWPSSIGKEALMQLGIGVVAMATSLVLRHHIWRGLLVGAAGGWVLWAVRPHLLALVTLAGGVAYLTGRVKSTKGPAALMSRPAGAVIIAVLMVFTVSQGAKFLGIEELSLSSIEAELDAQTERSAQGGSQFDNGGNSLNPINLPRGAVTVLLRPFPWETDSPLQLLSSLESALLGVLIIIRFSSVRLSLSRSRGTPFLLYAWTLTILYTMTFSSFANFGLLVRQRSLVLPALFVLISLDPVQARLARPNNRSDDDPGTADAESESLSLEPDGR